MTGDVMGDMPMPGGWTMSMMWMRMPGQTWVSAPTSFLGMWIVMMAAMMLPVLIPMLSHVRTRRLTTIVAAGYFFVWTVAGVVTFPLGAGLAALEMEHAALARAVPIAVGTVILMAGAVQLTAWKARQLACCRRVSSDHKQPADAGGAWRHGVRLGVRCGFCCANLMAILLAVGLMDVRAMAAVTVAIALERLEPAGARIARVIGVLIVAAGVMVIAVNSR